MTFLEQIGKRLSDAGQSVAQQTKNISDIAHLNSSISEKKQKISQLYLSIGQSYYAQYMDDPSATFAQEIAELKQLESEIAQCRDELNQLKGIVKCPDCGREVSSSSVFCSFCGAKIAQSTEPAAGEAPVCTEFQTSEEAPACTCCQMPEEEHTCTQCREPGDTPSRPQCQDSEDTPSCPNDQDSADTPSCPQCQAPVIPGNRFCTQCGARIESK